MSAVYHTLVRWASAVGDGGVSRFFTRSLKPRRTSAAPLTEMNTNYYPKKHLEEEEEYEPIATSSCLPPKTSPWLILPPTSKSGDMFYNFYSLSEAKVKSYSKRRILMDESEDDAYKIVGSSHGWLALFNNRNNDLFLSNPLLSPGQQVKLPPVDTLPEPSLSRDGHATISKVIISCSPYDTRRRCVAVMTYGPTDQLAFCLPGLSTKWTPVLDPYSKIEHPFITYSIIYDDIVCRPTRDSSISFIQSFFWVGLEDWETLDPTPTEVHDWSIDDDEVDGKTSLSFGFTRNVILRGEKCRWWLENEEVVAKCLQIPHLVVYAPTEEEEDEKKHRFFFVLRFLMPVRPDGNYDDGFCGWSGFVYRLKTVGFCLFELDDRGLDWKVVEKGSLDGLAMFVGINHSFALSAHDFPELEPNSIYYTHPHQIAPKWESNISDQDVGIFDYENKTFHPWFDIGGVDQRLQGIGPPLMWFTPNN